MDMAAFTLVLVQAHNDDNAGNFFLREAYMEAKMLN